MIYNKKNDKWINKNVPYICNGPENSLQYNKEGTFQGAFSYDNGLNAIVTNGNIVLNSDLSCKNIEIKDSNVLNEYVSLKPGKKVSFEIQTNGIIFTSLLYSEPTVMVTTNKNKIIVFSPKENKDIVHKVSISYFVVHNK